MPLLSRTWRLNLGVALATACLGAPVFADPFGPDGSGTDNERLRPGLYPAAPVAGDYGMPIEPTHPPFEIDWSVGLRGTFTQSTTGGQNFVTRLTPQASARYDGSLATIVGAASAEIAKPSGPDGVTITNMRLGVSGEMALDAVTTLNGDAALTLSKDLPGTLDLNPQIAAPQQILTGSLGIGLDRQFGRFNLGVDAEAMRTNYGPSTRLDIGEIDNADQNRWTAAGNLRVGYQVTPIFELFTEAGVSRDFFDVAGPSGEKADASNRTLRAGVSGSWNDVLTASVSAGVGQRVFHAGNLGDVTTQLYGASVSYTPDPTLRMTASLETTMEPTGPDNPGTARIRHAALANIDYTVNSWLRLRANADWSSSQFVGSNDTEDRFGLGAGADYSFNAHTALNADYGYGRRNTSSSGQTDSHQVSLGITLSR
ncbi:MAG: outer membrane beta-barrel protein [Devosia sp.]|uniref:outer membrane beta-barrel protein n=1 Tax=Devosia sp. TaxID=1871048 RepID=UPI001A021398|nr:outer membrane beta-barrel protein [Devosia sp.]MBF0679473.1 outer membrane beta-barrel protein [Devosia sp.]